MQTLFKGSKIKAKSFISGGKKLGSSIVGAARNNIVGFNKVAQSMVPQKKEENENSFIKNYTNFFGSKKTERILRKNLKLVRDSLVNTFEIAKLLRASIVSITGDLKGKGGKGGGGLFGGLGGLFGFLGGFVGIISGIIGLLTNPWIAAILAGTLFLNKEVRDAIIGFMRPIIESIAKAIYKNTTFRGWWGDGDLGGMGKRVNESIEDIGEARTLAVLKEEQKRLAALHEDNKGFFGRSDYKKDLNAITKQIERLESAGVVASTDAVQTVQDIGDFQERGEVRSNLQSDMEMELEAVKTATYNEMIKQLPEELRDKTGFMIKDGKVVMDPMAPFKRTGIEFQANNFGNKEAKAKLSRLLKWQQDFTAEAAKKQNVIRNQYDNQVNLPDLQSLYKKQNQNVEGKKSDLNTLSFADSLKLTENGNVFNFEPFTFNTAQEQNSSGGDVASTSSTGTTSGDAVTFYASSNSDPSYHKLNALMTFNIV